MKLAKARAKEVPHCLCLLKVSHQQLAVLCGQLVGLVDGDPLVWWNAGNVVDNVGDLLDKRPLDHFSHALVLMNNLPPDVHSRH